MREIRGFRAHSLGEGTGGGPASVPVNTVARTPQSGPGAERYRPIGDYGIIGDMRTAALVSSEGSIDWCCFPRFDSPSVFGRLLDRDRGGFWSVRPVGPFRSTPRYETGTNILSTRFATGAGAVELLDFMPVLEWDRQLASHHEIHRRVRAVGTAATVEIRLSPRFDYGRVAPRFTRRRHGVLVSDRNGQVLTVAASRILEWEIREGEARATLRLEAGETCWLVLRYDDDEVWSPSRYESEKKLIRTRSFWMDWVSGIQYEGEYREQVERSALALKLLFYAPTGAIVAAPTTSLPEEIGGSRNWDYRYSWLRDSTYTLFGLYALGKFEELDRYMSYLKKICRRESDHLQIMYGIGGEMRLPERQLNHLEGYRGSRPVRVGNAAVHQFQLDVYGEIMDSVHIWRRRYPMTEGMWELCQRLVREVMANWRRPDLGVWEFRTQPCHFVFSKVMCWVAMDRAIRAAEELGLPAELKAWRRCREEIRRDVLTHGWNAERGAFVQHYGTDRMDASNLLLPVLRFLPHDDPRVRSTIDEVMKELGHPSGLIHRYRTEDGLAGSEGAFCVNSFHLSQALALSGRRERAVEVFESVISYANPLGLLSEEIDPESGELLGNYPQAFSHIGLINAAHVLSRTRRRQTPDDFALLEG